MNTVFVRSKKPARLEEEEEEEELSSSAAVLPSLPFWAVWAVLLALLAPLADSNKPGRHSTLTRSLESWFDCRRVLRSPLQGIAIS